MPKFDPKKIIDFNLDYYSILNMNKEETINNVEFLKKLESNFRVKAKICHPDRGGNAEDFKNLLRAKQILEDKFLRQIYDSGQFEENISQENIEAFAIDWDKLGTYRKGTTADILGYSFFLMLAEEKETLNLVPSFVPKTNYDNYEWTFVLKDKPDFRLSISIIYDENEVYKLSSGLKTGNLLNFKIYVCIPTKQLNLKRDKDTKIKINNKVIMSLGKVTTATFDDFILLETASLDEAEGFFENIENIKTEIDNFCQGKKSSYRPNDQQLWLDENQIIKIENQLAQDILNLRSVFTVQDSRAADFLQNLPNEE